MRCGRGSRRTPLSLLRGMMNVRAGRRFSFAQIRQHPWYTRPNPLLTADGQVSDPVQLATQMLGNLHIDLTQEPLPSQRQAEAMDVDAAPAPEDWSAKFSATQPEAPISDSMFEWERPALRSLGTFAVSSTQPVSRSAFGDLAEEPSMSQFSQQPGVPPSLTQHARRFRDIVPAYSLTRFFSPVPPQLLVQMVSDALHQLNVPVPPTPPNLYSDHIASVKVKTVDGRNQSLHGEIMIDKYLLPEGQELLEVRFVKVKGDPLEWRRFFKKVALLCKDGVYSTDA